MPTYYIVDDNNNIIGTTTDINAKCPEGCELFGEEWLNEQFGL